MTKTNNNMQKTNLTKEFTLIKNPDEMKDDYYVKKFIKMLEKKQLVEWTIGKRGDYISSHFITANGSIDSLTSPSPNDENYSSLIHVHLYRVLQLFQDGA